MKTMRRILGGFSLATCAFLFAMMVDPLMTAAKYEPRLETCVGLFFMLLFLAGAVAGLCMLFGARWPRRMKTIHRFLGGIWTAISALFFMEIVNRFMYYRFFESRLAVSVDLFFIFLYLAGAVGGLSLAFGARRARFIIAAVALITMAAGLVGIHSTFDEMSETFVSVVCLILAPISAAVLLSSRKPVKFMIRFLGGLALTLVLTGVLSQLLDFNDFFFLREFSGLNYETALLLGHVVSFVVSVALVVVFLRWWDKHQISRRSEMNDAYDRRLAGFSWLSLAAPFIAYGLCFLACSQEPPWYGLTYWFGLGPDPYRAEVLMRFCAFLVAVIVAALVLFVDIGLKRWRLVWLPFFGLVFCYCFFLLTFLFEMKLFGSL